MKSNGVQNRWQGVRRDLKTQWTKLSEEDLDRIETRLNDVTDIIQKRYRYNRRKAEREVNRFARKYTAKVQEARSNVEGTVDDVQKNTDQALRQARRTIVRHPWQTVSSALAAGLVLGTVLGVVSSLGRSKD